MAAKLPLITRKNIRDEYTSKLPTLQEKLKSYTGEDYEFVVDFDYLFNNGINQNESYQKDSPGSIAFNAFEAFVEKLGRETNEGDDKLVKDFFNQVVSARKIHLLIEPMESGYATCRVKDGALELVYKSDNFGTNTSYIADDLVKKLDAAFAETNKGELPLIAKQGYQKEFLDKKAELEAKINEELLADENAANKITLVVDPNEIWKVANAEFDKLKKRDQSEIDLESISRNMGRAIYEYFDGFRYQINYRFKQDELMVEGFLECCPSKEVHFKLVPKPDLKRSYNEGVFVDGAYVIKASPQTWYTNTSYACEDIESLL